MGETVAIQRKRFSFKDAAAHLCHADLDKVEPGVCRIKLLSTAPFIVHLRKLRDPLKGGEHIRGRAGGIGKAIEQGLVDIENLGGLRNGEHIQAAVRQTAFLHEGLNISGELVFGEVVVQIGKQPLFPKLDGKLGIAGKDVRHIRRAWITVDDHGQALVQFGAGGNGGNIDDDTLLFAHRGIELVDQIVHGLLHIPAVIVPHGQGHRLFRIQRRSGSAPGQAPQQEHQRQEQRDCLFHSVFLRSAASPIPNPILF